jgi:hypothetical protein
MKQTYGKIKTVIISIVLTFLLLSNEAYAAGGPSNPYEHIPEDTGFEANILYLAGILLFLSGLAILSTVRSIKSKINKAL